MTFWEAFKKSGPGWPDQRGWYALALFLQTSGIFVLIAAVPSLSDNEFFKTLAQAVVVTGWVGYAVAGRDSRFDREQVGQAQQLARDILDRVPPSPAEQALNGARRAMPDAATDEGAL